MSWEIHGLRTVMGFVLIPTFFYSVNEILLKHVCSQSATLSESPGHGGEHTGKPVESRYAGQTPSFMPIPAVKHRFLPWWF